MNLADRLIEALGPERQHTAIVISAVYQPVGGPGRTIMPPTYPVSERETDPNARYLVSERLVHGEQRKTVIIDQEPSQANRVEEALLAARDAGLLQLPIFEMRTATPLGEIRLTSLDFPHRYADAYLRDSLVDGIRFDRSAPGQRLRATTVADVRPLYEREPCSLLLGAWDSHRRGRWPRFARQYAAAMYGLDPVAGGRRGGRMDPVNLTGGITPTESGGDWRFTPEGPRSRGTRLSEIGHGNIAPNPVPGGVTVSEVRRDASISLAGLERLRFGDASAEAAVLARAALAALGLAGDRLAFGRPSVWLRSGCDLARVSETLGLERPGGDVDELAVTAQGALDTFHELRDRAAAAGVAMAGDVIAVTPVPALAEAIEFAVTSGSQDDEGAA
jgi:CRISPR-associated protein Csb1